jgi:hypothetical protein
MVSGLGVADVTESSLRDGPDSSVLLTLEIHWQLQT